MEDPLVDAIFVRLFLKDYLTKKLIFLIYVIFYYKRGLCNLLSVPKEMENENFKLSYLKTVILWIYQI